MSTFTCPGVIVADVKDHPNADRLDIVSLEGMDFTLVRQKGIDKPGDFRIYVPENALVPEYILKAGFWDKEKDKGILAGSKGNRVKAVRLRGSLSQGLLLDPERIPDLKSTKAFMPGEDYAEMLLITKYIPPVPVEMSGKVYHCPGIQSYTDIENLKRYPDVLDPNETVVGTEKIHGTCCVFYYDGESDMLHVSSKGLAAKGLALEHNLDNLYWKIADKYQIGDALRLLAFQADEDSLTLYGEGVGVQDLMYGRTKGDPGFAGFDIRRSDGSFVDVIAGRAIMQAMGIPTVPALVVGRFADVVGHTQGKESLTGDEVHLREGLVIRPIQEREHPELGRVILKSISEDYLLRKGGTELE